MAIDFYDIQYRRTTDTAADAWRVLPPVPAHISPEIEIPAGVLEVGETYDIRVRFRDADGGISAWQSLAPHTVAGLDGPPPTPDDVDVPDGDCLTWRCPVDGRRVAGFHIRYALGEYDHWADMTPAHEGLWPSPPFPLCLVPGGPLTIAVAAVTAHGVESVEPAFLSVQVRSADPQLPVMRWRYDVGGEGWPGQVVNGSIVSDEVVGSPSAEDLFGPEALALFGDYDDAVEFAGDDDEDLFGADVSLDARAFGGDTPDSEFGPAVSYEDLQLTVPVPVPPAIAGVDRILTIDLETDGRNVRLEYRTNTEPFGPDVAERGFGAEIDDESAEPFGPGAGAAWRPWPGRLPATGGALELRVTAPGGEAQPKVRALRVTVSSAA